MNIAHSAVDWVRRLPISGNLRSAALEIAFELDETGEEWVTLPDRLLAERCHVQEKTIQNHQAQLRAIADIDRSNGIATRYRLRRTSVTVTEVPPKNFPREKWVFPAPLSQEEQQHTHTETPIPIPKPFPISDELRNWAADHRVEVALEEESELFVNHYKRKRLLFTMEEWEEAWQSWMCDDITIKRSRTRAAKPNQRRNYGDHSVSTTTERQRRSAEETCMAFEGVLRKLGSYDG